MEQLCDKCRTPLTAETKMTTFDAQQNRLTVCKNKNECDNRIRKEEWKVKEEAERPMVEEQNRLINEFGHLPKEEQLKQMFNIEMKDFSKEIPTRGGVVYYQLPDGTQYQWHLFQSVWRKCY